MCDPRCVPAADRPRWSGLYAILLAGTAALGAVDATVAAPVLRKGLECALLAASYGAAAGWLRAHRVALDQTERGASPPAEVSVRVIRSRARQSPPAVTPPLPPTVGVRRDMPGETPDRGVAAPAAAAPPGGRTGATLGA